MHSNFISKKMLLVTLLGFSSGLPLALTSTTLQLWYEADGIDIQTISMLTLVSTPYVYKFLWAPGFDYVRLPFLTKRRSWIIVFQFLLSISCFLLGSSSPKDGIEFFAIVAFAISFFSASQDVVIDAYKTELLEHKERGFGSAYATFGYRLAMFVSGGFALILADVYGFAIVYTLMGFILLILMLVTVKAKEPELEIDSINTEKKKLISSIFSPITDFFLRFSKNSKIKSVVIACLMLLLIVVYKIGDAFAFTLSSYFLKHELGFSLSVLGTVQKAVTITFTIAGVFVGGAVLERFGLYKALLAFAFLQGLSNLSYMYLAILGQDYYFMIFTIAVEYLCAGMGTAAFLALLMGLCNHKYTATQYAVFSALSAVGRVYSGLYAGTLVQLYGWVSFFSLTAIMAIPGIILLFILKNYIDAIK